MKIPLISNPNGSVIYIFHEWKIQECHQAQLFYHLYSFMDCGVNRKKALKKNIMKYFVVGLHTYIIFGKWGKKCANRKLKNKMQKNSAKTKRLFCVIKWEKKRDTRVNKKSNKSHWNESQFQIIHIAVNWLQFVAAW